MKSSPIRQLLKLFRILTKRQSDFDRLNNEYKAILRQKGNFKKPKFISMLFMTVLLEATTDIHTTTQPWPAIL